MNRQEVLEALRAAVDPESERYKKVSAEYGDLNQDAAERARAQGLGGPVAEVLRRQPEYVQYPAMAIQDYVARTVFPPERAAEALVLRAMRANAETAVNWLYNIFERRRATGTLVMPLWRLSVEEPISLSRDASLVPFSQLPQSHGKTWLEDPANRFHGGGILPVTSLGSETPGAAITLRIAIEPLFVNWFDYQQLPDEKLDVLDDLRLCLSAVGPYPLLGPIKWFQFEDPDLAEIGPRGFGSNRLEILPRELPQPTVLEADSAQRLVAKFLVLPVKDRGRVRVALQRLVQAMLRREAGDRAADLSIALEALLTDGRGEHTWKVSTRAAVLTGWDLRSMLDHRSVISAVYDMRSSLVHTGAASDRISVSGRGKQPAGAVCEEATRICAAVIRAIIERGGIPAWPQFDVSGGVFGWR